MDTAEGGLVVSSAVVGVKLGARTAIRRGRDSRTLIMVERIERRDQSHGLVVTGSLVDRWLRSWPSEPASRRLQIGTK